ncbi:MAG: arginase [Chloroflexi bacterium]|nr:MAG: arginase [Chloroflexota bacterium]MBL1193790.1 arginase [Chloroflexota bacterium]NOH11083.1 arginase [Chloroflexota bacterium]
MEIDLIGVPIDFGAGRRGVDMGPSAIRYAGLQTGLNELGCTVFDKGNLEVPILETCEVTEPKLRYIDCIVPVARHVMGLTATASKAGRIPLVLGGDHSLSIGSVRGAARNKKLGVLWIDAHADFNTHETTPSGNIHGMSLAALCGYGDGRLVGLGDDDPQATIDPHNVAIIGARDLDPGEVELLKEAGVHVFPIEHVDRIGLADTMRQALEITTTGTDGLYLSFDLDALDPMHAPGVGTPVSGGMSYREAHLACEMIAESGALIGLEFMEVNPILDIANRTAELAAELAFSALGKRVWG